MNDPHDLRLWLRIILDDYGVPEGERPNLKYTARRNRSNLASFRPSRNGGNPNILIGDPAWAMMNGMGSNEPGFTVSDMAKSLLCHEVAHFLMWYWGHRREIHSRRFCRALAPLEHEYAGGWHDEYGLLGCRGTRTLERRGIYLC